MTPKLRWGILATGNMAATFVRNLAHSKDGVAQAVAGRQADQAQRFAATHQIPNVHGCYEDLLADPSVDVVYIATLHPTHAAWAIKAAEAGKHILCEKPLTLNHATAVSVIAAAACNDVFLMEALMYRCHPQTTQLIDLLRRKTIGTVLGIEATFSYDYDFDPENRVFSPLLGGGGILDVGCYLISTVRLIAGVAHGGAIAEPLDFKALGHLGPSGVDENSVAIMRFPGDILAQVACGVRLQRDNCVRIQGTGGQIFVPTPWTPARQGGRSVIEVIDTRGTRRELGLHTDAWLWSLEADTVAAAIRDGRRQAVFPAPTWDDTLSNMRVLDRWREDLGLVFPQEKPARGKQPPPDQSSSHPQ